MPSKQKKLRSERRAKNTSIVRREMENETQNFNTNEHLTGSCLGTPCSQFSSLAVITPPSCLASTLPTSSNNRSRGHPRKRKYYASASSTPSLPLENSCSETPIKKGGRPKKRTRMAGPGRGHRSSSSSRQTTPVSVTAQFSLMETEKTALNDLDSEPLAIPQLPAISNFACTHRNHSVDFESIESLQIPGGTPPALEGRVAPAELFAQGAEMQLLWASPERMIIDDLIYAFDRFLASITYNKRVAVLSPLYTNLDVHFGPGAMHLDPHDHCYNHSQDYDILLITVCLPIHFALIVFDRSEREDPKCIYVDSLPFICGQDIDRLMDCRYQAYDARRKKLILQTICQLTPGLTTTDFELRRLPCHEYTCQTDGTNCGFFVILYAEAYLMNNGCLILPHLNINLERKRILWHLAQLFTQNNGQYIPRQTVMPQALLHQQIGHTQRTISQSLSNSSRETSIASNTSSRQSARIASRNSSRESSVEDAQTTVEAVNPLTRRCHIRHRDLPCADIRAEHNPHYYDSGNFGDKTCDFCKAILLASEASMKSGKTSSAICCNFGKIRLPELSEPPTELLRLSIEYSDVAKEFRRNQNAYNSLLAFASVSVSHKENTMGDAVCFMLNGEFVRRISSLFAGQLTPSFAQLFVLDPEQALEHRMQNTRYGGDRVNPNTLLMLDRLLRTHHPLANQLMNFHQQYMKSLEENGHDAVQNFRLTLLEARMAPSELRDPNLHSRQTNLPTEGTLFAVWTESDHPPVEKGIWITTDQGELKQFAPYHPMTDTLCYPLLLPCGDDGYHKNLMKTAKKNRSSVRTNEEYDNDQSSEMQVDVDDSEYDSPTDNEVESQSDVSSENSDNNSESNTNKKISLREYVRYRMALSSNQSYHHIWSAAGGLSQKMILDYAARIDADVADYLRRPELDLRGTLPEHLLRWFARNAGLTSPEEIGSVVLFRKYQPGTLAYFQNKYYDATTIMARVRHPANACFMLTWTCNPRWPEIKRNFLRTDQKVVDRFDILCRVYEDKLKQIHTLLDTKKILGKQIGYGEGREFQKRIGGPHLHRLYQSDIMSIPECIDNLIWAHIPSEPDVCDHSSFANFIRKVRKLLPKYQFHDCGSHCKNVHGRCSKGFPKPFSKFTILFDDKPAVYKRPSPQDGGETLTITRGRVNITYDNSRVIPYNPFLMVLFETHHNLEFAYGKSTNMKYPLKYPLKGPSYSYIQSKDTNKTNIDEPASYAKVLYRSPVEAFSRILSYKYAFLSHTVMTLSIHLPGQQKMYVRPGQDAQQIAQQLLNGQIEPPETPLTAYWKQWRIDPAMQNILFENMPEKYSFQKKTKLWKLRKISPDPQKIAKRKPIIGRIYPIMPRAHEKFALFILTKHFPGDPEHLKAVNGQQCETFLEAARKRGLIKDSNVWIRTLEEGSNSLNPAQMRQLFSSILIFGNTEDCIIDASALWNRFLPHMYDTRCTEAERPRRIDRALALLERLLVAQGRTCAEFGLPSPINSIVNDPARGINAFFFPSHLADDEADETIDTEQFNSANLNTEQQNFFQTVRNVSMAPPNNTDKRLFFLSGDGGSGKTFLLNYLLYQLRRIGKKVIATASTGMASTRFYAGGTTVHSAFRLGIQVETGKIPQIPFDSYFGRRIIEADVLIIDEITMLEKVVLENVDLLCRTMVPRFEHIPFAAKVVILSGDWKQSLPVVTEAFGTAAQVAVCIQSSHLYALFTKIKLQQNMRVNVRDIEFMDWLEKVGKGAFGETVPIPKEWIVNTRDEVVSSVFDQGFTMPSNEMLKRLLLGTTNRIVDLNNDAILKTFTTEYMDYYSEDRPLNENPMALNAADQDVSQLNLLNPAGIPAHRLRLKVGSIIVLLINLNTSKSLCNGTRMIIKKMTDNLITAEAITGGSSRTGVQVAIPRVATTYKDKQPGGISFERFQFPVRVAFTMTVTKAQGQTCEKLGIDFTEESFAHGQTYTAFSRATNPNAIRVYAPNKPTDDEGNVLVRNIVAEGIRFD